MKKLFFVVCLVLSVIAKADNYEYYIREYVVLNKKTNEKKELTFDKKQNLKMTISFTNDLVSFSVNTNPTIYYIATAVVEKSKYEYIGSYRYLTAIYEATDRDGQYCRIWFGISEEFIFVQVITADVVITYGLLTK